jgi:hypothetical protein
MWWTNQAAGYVGAAIGILGGIFGTTLGLAGAFLKTPRQFALVKVFVFAFAALGLAALIAGIYAVTQGQPYHVYYPLLLAGLLFSILPVALLPALKMRLRVIEQRRMESAALRNT